MRYIINELRSINHTEGEWKLIVPSSAEGYFHLALRNMEDGALSNAKATVCLIDSSKNDSLDKEIQRGSSGSIPVKYGEY